MDRDDFQVVFATSIILTLYIGSALVLGIFFDPDAFALLLPLVILGFIGLIIYLGGKVYDWRNKK